MSEDTETSASAVDYKGLLIFLTIALMTVLAMLVAGKDNTNLVALIGGAAVISIVIWQACDPFAEAAQWIGKRFHVPGSVRGATLDAVASSMPELYSGIFFVIVAFQYMNSGGPDTDPLALETAEAMGAEGFGSAVATCAGSAIYNMILIPACVALVVAMRRKDNPIVKIEKEVVQRDGMWFLVCELVVVFFLFQEAMYPWMALVLMGMYALYVGQLWLHARRHRKALLQERKDINLEEGIEGDEEFDYSVEGESSTKAVFGIFTLPITGVTAWLIILGSTVVAAIACYFLVDVTHATAHELNVPTFFVALVLAAAVSSVPDTFLSIGAGLRGDDSGAVSNAFGSNIFDICICLSVPLLVNSWLTGWGPVHMTQNGEPMEGIVQLRILLLVLSAITVAIIWYKFQLGKVKAFILIGLYLVYLVFAVLGSLGILSPDKAEEGESSNPEATMKPVEQLGLMDPDIRRQELWG